MGDLAHFGLLNLITFFYPLLFLRKVPLFLNKGGCNQSVYIRKLRFLIVQLERGYVEVTLISSTL